MQEEELEPTAPKLEGFTLPRYEEIPDVGLFLEQTVKYINTYLALLPGTAITGSMVGNYVKKKLLANPIKKQYDREKISYLFFIAVTKSVLSLEQIGLLLEFQKKRYSAAAAYNYFCTELKNVLELVFARENVAEAAAFSGEKDILRSTIITVAHKIYLNKVFDAISAERAEATD